MVGRGRRGAELEKSSRVEGVGLMGGAEHEKPSIVEGMGLVLVVCI